MEVGRTGWNGILAQQVVAIRPDFVTVQILLQLTVAHIVQHLQKTRGLASATALTTALVQVANSSV